MQNVHLTENSTEIQKFNHNLSLLLKQLKLAYPDDKDLKLYEGKFEMGKSFTPFLACQLFIGHTKDYVHQIIFEQEEDFLKMQFADLEVDLNLINKIITVWTHEPEDPKIRENHLKLKKNIWAYLKLLLNYGARALNKQDLLDQIKQESKAYAKQEKANQTN